MQDAARALSDPDIWCSALQAYGGVTHLSAAVYDAEARLIQGPVPSTPLFALFEHHGYDPGLMSDCVRQCLTQTTHRPAVVVTSAYNLAVVGTSLIFDGQTVGAIVAGYVIVSFSQASAMQRLARDALVPFDELWEVVRQESPVPERRLIMHGELLQVLCDTILRDYHRAHQLEEVAAQLTESAAAKDEFLAVLSHELRAPLTPILGWARLLKVWTDPAKVAHAATVIERNALLQVRLVEDLLALNSAARGKIVLDLKVQDVRGIVGLALETILEGAARNDVRVQLLDAPEPVHVNVDANRLQQTLSNILLNALKFTPSGGAITVAVDTEGDAAVIRVRDTGQGIAPEFLPFVFDMFRQQEVGTRRVHAGLGIGLALVKRLTELHGGRVSIASEGVGRGAEVTLWLPLAAAAEPPLAEPHLQPALDGIRVLVVEDMEDIREAIREVLVTRGIAVQVATDGIAALSVLEKDRAFDLVLCDLRMPSMDGYEFLAAVRRHPEFTRLPVVALSAQAGAAAHERTTLAGFDAHIDKPINETRLLSTVAVLVGRVRHAEPLSGASSRSPVAGPPESLPARGLGSSAS